MKPVCLSSAPGIRLKKSKAVSDSISQRRCLPEEGKDRRERKADVRILSVFLRNISIIYRFLMNNKRYRTTTLRPLRP